MLTKRRHHEYTDNHAYQRACTHTTKNSKPSLINKIKKIKQIPYIANCSDIHYWQLVSETRNIPALISTISDSSPIKDVYVPNFGGEYSVGDIALTILQEKIKGMPVLNLVDNPSRQICGRCAYWQFVRANPNNRLRLQQKVLKWYQTHYANLQWIKTSHSNVGDCSNPLKTGHYQFTK